MGSTRFKNEDTKRHRSDMLQQQSANGSRAFRRWEHMGMSGTKAPLHGRRSVVAGRFGKTLAKRNEFEGATAPPVWSVVDVVDGVFKKNSLTRGGLLMEAVQQLES